MSAGALKFACGKARLKVAGDGQLRNREVKSIVCHNRHSRVKREANSMKVVLVFVVAVVVVVFLKSMKRSSKDESANGFHRFDL